jgi:hypothetical protein
MKISLEEVHNFRQEDLKDIIKNDITGFQLLEKGDLLSLFKFFCAFCGEQKPDVFVTMCPLLLENRDNLQKNSGMKILTLDEILKLIKEGEK